ncbi:MAG: IMP dehydrogenase [Acidimicrobiales bacterium]
MRRNWTNRLASTDREPRHDPHGPDLRRRPSRSSTVEHSKPERCFARNLAHQADRIELPVIAANMDTVCETDMAVAMARLGGIGIIHRFLTIESQTAMVAAVKAASTTEPRTGRSARGNALLVGAAVGTDHDTLPRSLALVDAGVDVLVLDIAHGHADHAIDTLGKIKAAHPRST